MNRALTVPPAAHGLAETGVPSIEGTAHVAGPFPMRRGGQLSEVRMAYEAWGQLSQERDNAVLILTGLSPDAHARSSKRNPHRGWWEEMIGPGSAIDTDKFFVLCVNNLGSCFGSTGPASINPETRRPYGLDFPELSIEDLARAAHAVVASFGIERLHGLVGPSMGGMTALAYALEYPHEIERISLCSSASRPEAQAIAVHSLQREAIKNDPNWRWGEYSPENRPVAGMRLARKIGMTSYRSAVELEQRFAGQRTVNSPSAPFELEFEVERYLEARSTAFVETFDANAYLYLSRAMDLFDAADHGSSLVDALSRIQARAFQIIGVESDALFPLRQQDALAEALEAADQAVQFVAIDSPKGHDAFLAETERFGPILSNFLG
jgi:homoserine O-acetyltransferase/O-succinyltransferase